MGLEIGQILGGRYAVERIIGTGSLGAVYQSRDQTDQGWVAIRLISPSFDSDVLASFDENEARAAGQLAHPTIAQLITLGFLPTGERCILAEYIEGESLSARIQRQGRVPHVELAQVLLQTLKGLAEAHSAGVVHRDLTPRSILLQGHESPAVRLIDFGISRLKAYLGNTAAARSAGLHPDTFQYLSPEQLSGLRPMDGRSNIYSLGVIAYEAMTGRMPFAGQDFSDPSLAVLHDDPPAIEEVAPESSRALAAIVHRAMSRSPNSRFQSAGEMIHAISNLSRRTVFEVSAPASSRASEQAPAPSERAVGVEESARVGSTPPVSERVPAASSVLQESGSAAQEIPPVVTATPSPVAPIDLPELTSDIDQSHVDAMFAPPKVAPVSDLGFDIEPSPSNAPVAHRESYSLTPEEPPPSSSLRRQRSESPLSSSPVAAGAFDSDPSLSAQLAVDDEGEFEQPARSSPVTVRAPDSQAPTQRRSDLPAPSSRYPRTILGIGMGGPAAGSGATDSEAPRSQSSRPLQATEPGIQREESAIAAGEREPAPSVTSVSARPEERPSFGIDARGLPSLDDVAAPEIERPSQAATKPLASPAPVHAHARTALSQAQPSAVAHPSGAVGARAFSTASLIDDADALRLVQSTSRKRVLVIAAGAVGVLLVGLVIALAVGPSTDSETPHISTSQADNRARATAAGALDEQRNSGDSSNTESTGATSLSQSVADAQNRAKGTSTKPSTAPKSSGTSRTTGAAANRSFIFRQANESYKSR